MPRLLVILAAIIAALPGSIVLLSSASADERPTADKPQTQEQKEAIHLSVYGKLQDDVVAIGGETTGTTVTAQNMTFELVLSPELKRLAAEHQGEPVLVEGTLRVEPGVEIPTRLMLHAEKLRYGRPGPMKMPHAKITIRGKLQTGIAAIGAETTGTEISAQGTKWELDLQDKKKLADKAERLAGKEVVAAGKLTKIPGVERPDRYVIKTSRLDEAAD